MSNTSTKDVGNTCFANLSSVREEHFPQATHINQPSEAPFSTKSSLREAKPPKDFRHSSDLAFKHFEFSNQNSTIISVEPFKQGSFCHDPRPSSRRHNTNPSMPPLSSKRSDLKSASTPKIVTHDTLLMQENPSALQSFVHHGHHFQNLPPINSTIDYSSHVHSRADSLPRRPLSMQGPGNKGPDHFQRKYQRSRTRASRLRDKLAVSENARDNLAQENQGLSLRVREL